jgi:outer membrane protein TolC
VRPRRRASATPLALALALFAGEAGAIELDLAGAVATALERNPALLAVEALRSEVAGGIVEARAAAFPEIALLGSWGQSRSPALLNSPDFEEFVEQFPGGAFAPATQELYRAGVELKQTLWSFGKVGTAIELAKVVADAADARIAAARLDTGLAAAEGFFAVLAAREGLATLEAERELRRSDLERVASLLAIGEATELEELRARAALAEVEPEVARRQGEVAVAESRLRQLLALAPGEPLALAAERRERTRLPDVPPLEELVARALDSRPETTDLELQEEIFRKRQKITRADGLPGLELNGAWGREARLFDNFGDALYDAWSFSLDLRWELFDGGRRRGQIAQLESQRQQLVWQQEDLRARIRLETDRAHSDYRTSRSRAESAEAAARAAREALRVARANYEEGVATQTDLLDAQSRATAADVLAVEVFYDALAQASRLARAVGELPTASWNRSQER